MRNLDRLTKPLIPGLLWAGITLGTFACQPRENVPLPEPATWFIAADRYRSSVHGRLPCEKCHADLAGSLRPEEKRNAHGKNLPDRYWTFSFAECKSCHPREFDSCQGGSHGAALEELATGLPNCSHCHSAHYGQRLRSRREAVALELRVCGSCHAREAAALTRDQHPAPGHALADGFACGTCHDVHAAEKLTRSPLGQPACQKCHAQDQKGFSHEAQ